LLLAVAAVRADTRGAVDWIFLVDTSASMRGKGGTKDIFDDVKGSIATFVDQADVGDSVSVYTFDSGVTPHDGTRDIHGPFDREELKATIAGLQANGKRTHLGLAIAKGLQRAEQLKQRNDPTRSRAVVLLTDGKEDVRGIENPTRIAGNLQRIADTWVFFVSMGEHEAQLDEFSSAAQRSMVLKPQDPEAIRAAMRQIRTKIKPPRVATRPRPPVLTLTPTSLLFNNTSIGETTEERELTISSDKPTRVSVSLAAAPGITMSPRDDVPVAPNAPARLKIALTVAEDAPPGAQSLTITVVPAAGKTVLAAGTLTITKPSPLIRIAKWLVALALLAIAAVVARKRYKAGNELEGELEIVKPRVASEAAFVGLPTLKTDHIALSAIVPLDALAGSDARLFVKRKGSEKKVWIAASSGSLRVNDVETPMSELYDADTILIGDAKLRFNRLGHERVAAFTGEEPL
jgi:hypothetical protein